MYVPITHDENREWDLDLDLEYSFALAVSREKIFSNDVLS